MKFTKNAFLTRVEKIVLLFVFALILFGIIASYINKAWFENVYVVEDGFIEWLTVLPLLITFVVAISYLLKPASKRSWIFFIVMLVTGLFCFFAAGEEISWGQRIFHIKSPEYFVEHNTQQELNIHNLVVDNEQINKIVFSQMLIGVAVLYLVALPILYNKNQKFRRFADWAGVPVARLYQILGCAAVFILSAVTSSDKGSELLEFGGCFMFMLIVSFPQNKEVFRKNLVRSSG